MFTALTLAALAITPALGLKEYVSAATRPNYLTQSEGGGTSVSVTIPGWVPEPLSRQWEVVGGQLRLATGKCAFPVGSDYTTEAVFGPDTLPYEISIKLFDCEDGKYDHWAIEGEQIKWREFCLGELKGGVG